MGARRSLTAHGLIRRRTPPGLTRRPVARRAAPIAVWTAVSLLAAARPVVAQEDRPIPPPDSARADSTRLPEGVEILPDSMRIDFPPGAEEEAPEPDEGKRVPGYPEVPALPDSSFSYEVREWSREEVISSNALSLIGFLEDVMPGFTTVRANYFNGAHQLTDGPFGAGFVRVLVDGREVPPLESGQDDLIRFPLVYLDKVRVRRSSSGFIVEIFTRRQHEARAYARVGGGTGSPKLDLVSGIFSNGWGSAVTVAAAFDVLNVRSGDLLSDRLDFWATLAWMPRSNRTGFQLQWKSQSIDRLGDDSAELKRRDVAFTGRSQISSTLVADLALSSTALTVLDSQLVEVNRAGIAVTGSPRWGFARAEVAVQGGGPAYPSVAGGITAGVRIARLLGLDVEVEGSTWDGFDAGSVRGGLAIGPFTSAALVIRAGGATGTRGVSRPLSGTADSLSFDAFTSGLELSLGPYDLGARLSFQSVSRQLPFGAAFDAVLQPGPGVDVTAFEGELSGPIVPLGVLIKGLSPLVITGFWRHQTPSADAQAIYLPVDVARGRLGFTQRFFKGDLLVQLGLGFLYRSAMLSSAPGVPNPLPVPEQRRLNLDLLLQIKDFQIWLRADNLTGTEDEDVVGFPYPRSLTLFGVKWEFFN